MIPTMLARTHLVEGTVTTTDGESHPTLLSESVAMWSFAAES
jgi:hypothetical protein